MASTRKSRSKSGSGSKTKSKSKSPVLASSGAASSSSAAASSSSAAAAKPVELEDSVVEPNTGTSITAIIEAAFPVSVPTKTRKLLSTANIKSRKRTKELGKGTFGRVNEETVASRGISVATKYPLREDLIQENITEIATIKYLEGLPHVSQFLGTADQNTTGSCVVFPCMIMEAAKNNLDKLVYPNWDYTFKTVIGVLKGYDTLHSAYIVHRDTKPGNMLMSTTDEVLITDFGTCRYTPPNMPPCQDGYTGTYWYSAPELLIKKYMKVRKPISWAGLYAADAWAVGTALYQIVVGTPLFTDADARSFFNSIKHHQIKDKTALHVLINMYSKLGTPIEKDGEMFVADNAFAKQAGISLSARTKEVYAGATLDQNPKAVYIRVVSRSKFRTNDKQLRLVATIIQRLLDYNPETRLTIRGALKLLLRAGYIKTDDLAPKYDKDIFDQYMLPARLMASETALVSSSSASVPSWAITKSAVVATVTWLYSFKWPLAADSIYFVFDRALLILMATLRHLHHKISKNNIDIIGLVSVVMAAYMFDSTGIGLSLEKAISMRSNIKHRFNTLYKYVKEIVLTDIQFYGTTFYDLLIQEVKPKRANDINALCYRYCLYSDFLSKAKPAQVTEFLLEFGKSEKDATKNNLVTAFAEYIA